MGPNYSISTACATSNFCILNAANHIIRGEAVSIQFQHFLVRLWNSHIFLTFLFEKNFVNSNMIIFSERHKILSLPMQDLMLCGGSDAAIIPIGILFTKYLWLARSYLGLNIISIQQCLCRFGWLCSVQGTFTEK